MLDKLGALYKDEYSVQYNSTIWSCPSLERATLAAAMPFENKEGEKLDSTKQARNLVLSLTGLHTLAGATLPESALSFYPNRRKKHPNFPMNDIPQMKVAGGILKSTALLIQQAEELASQVSLREAVELRWAIRGIVVRFGLPLIAELHLDEDKKIGST